MMDLLFLVFGFLGGVYWYRYTLKTNPGKIEHILAEVASKKEGSQRSRDARAREGQGDHSQQSVEKETAPQSQDLGPFSFVPKLIKSTPQAGSMDQPSRLSHPAGCRE